MMVDSDKVRLEKIRILLVESDTELAMMLRSVLQSLGFSNVSRVANGQLAVDLMRTEEFDIVITELDLAKLDGIELVYAVRNKIQNHNLMIPIIMLTWHSDKASVERARDVGITEFLTKPFTSASLYERIRRIFDQPRDFIISPNYVGPNRRFHSVESDIANQRQIVPITVPSQSLQHIDFDAPAAVLPDYVLRRKAGLKRNLSTIISRKKLLAADEVIQHYSNEKISISSINDHVKALVEYVDALQQQKPIELNEAERMAITLKGHAGMIGYELVSDVAMSLYLFLKDDFNPMEPRHISVFKKHTDIMQTLLGSEKASNGIGIKTEVAQELNVLKGHIDGS